MAVGITVSKDSINNSIGRLSSNFMNLLDEIATTNDFMATQDAAALEALGFSAGDAALLGSIMTDLNLARSVLTGGTTQSSLKDFRVFVRQAGGMRA